MKVHMNSLFPVPSQQSNSLQRLWAHSCHVPGPSPDEGVFCSTDKWYIVHCSGVGHTMSLSAVSFKKMKHKSKTHFTWDVFLPMKLALPILKENIILSVFKSLLYRLLLTTCLQPSPPPPNSGTKATGTEGLFLIKMLKLGELLAFWRGFLEWLCLW